ncbi:MULTISPECIES: hypothetical protein [unclassified Paenibacillus]|uniref:hypothetical protein n=1 Tax=unclassified Paenibacillus TaxID=185978 RepID=UPI003D7EA20F
MINFHVYNDCLSVGHIDIFGVSSASLIQIGDTEHIQLYSMFDTPPESVIVSPIAPFPQPEGVERAACEAGLKHHE